MRVCTRVLIVSEECVVLPISCPTIIQVAKKTRLVLHTISYNVNLITLCRRTRFVLCGSVGKGENNRDTREHGSSHKYLQYDSESSQPPWCRLCGIAVHTSSPFSLVTPSLCLDDAIILAATISATVLQVVSPSVLMSPRPHTNADV